MEHHCHRWLEQWYTNNCIHLQDTNHFLVWGIPCVFIIIYFFKLAASYPHNTRNGQDHAWAKTLLLMQWKKGRGEGCRDEPYGLRTRVALRMTAVNYILRMVTIFCCKKTAPQLRMEANRKHEVFLPTHCCPPTNSSSFLSRSCTGIQIKWREALLGWKISIIWDLAGRL